MCTSTHYQQMLRVSVSFQQLVIKGRLPSLCLGVYRLLLAFKQTQKVAIPRIQNAGCLFETNSEPLTCVTGGGAPRFFCQPRMCAKCVICPAGAHGKESSKLAVENSISLDVCAPASK